MRDYTRKTTQTEIDDCLNCPFDTCTKGECGYQRVQAHLRRNKKQFRLMDAKTKRRAIYKLNVANGICPVCKRRQSPSGYVLCDKCRERQNANSRRWYYSKGKAEREKRKAEQCKAT